jgi:hypothetical protein
MALDRFVYPHPKPPQCSIFVDLGKEGDVIWHHVGCVIENVYVRGGVKEVDSWIDFEDIDALHAKISDYCLKIDAPMSGAVFMHLRKELLLSLKDVAVLTETPLAELRVWETGGFSLSHPATVIREAYYCFRETGKRPKVIHSRVAAA